MSEQFLPDHLVDQLDETVDALLAPRDTAVLTSDDQSLAELVSLAGELYGLPRQSFKSNLKETLRRSALMTMTATETLQD
ncbi:MAG TPA: hypothetical protein VGC61_08525, partial [Pyrinomonadaceae bacterium]